MSEGHGYGVASLSGSERPGPGSQLLGSAVDLFLLVPRLEQMEASGGRGKSLSAPVPQGRETVPDAASRASFISHLPGCVMCSVPKQVTGKGDRMTSDDLAWSTLGPTGSVWLRKTLKQPHVYII